MVQLQCLMQLAYVQADKREEAVGRRPLALRSITTDVHVARRVCSRFLLIDYARRPKQALT